MANLKEVQSIIDEYDYNLWSLAEDFFEAREARDDFEGQLQDAEETIQSQSEEIDDANARADEAERSLDDAGDLYQCGCGECC